MRVSVFSQYFPPEIGAGQTRVHTFAAGLAARGFDVHVVCEVPNHPEGRVHPGFAAWRPSRRSMDGFRVTYVPVLASPRKTPARRLGFYGSYVAAAGALGLGGPRPDAVFASSPPLPVGIPALLSARRHRCPLVLDIRDLWPEAAVAMGELSNERLVRAVDAVGRRLYRGAAAITTVTEPFRAALAAKAGEEKVHVLPNGTSARWLQAGGTDVPRGESGVPSDRFAWTYAGNMSGAQRLASAVDAAALLGPGFCLVLMGAGPEREALERRAAEVAPGLVEFRPLAPPEQAMRVLRASDALLVQLAAEPALEDFVPSKLYDYCAIGRPVIVAAAGEPSRLAEAESAGLPVRPGDAEALAAAVRRLRDDDALCRSLAHGGRAFAADSLRDRQVERLAALLEDTVSARR